MTTPTMKLGNYILKSGEFPHQIDWDRFLRDAPSGYVNLASSVHHMALKQCHFSAIEHLNWERDRRLAAVEERAAEAFDTFATDDPIWHWGDNAFEETEAAMQFANLAYDRLAIHQSYAHYEEQLYRVFAETIRRANASA